MDLRKYIRNIPDFPKPGIQFKDITTLILVPEAFKYAVDQFVNRYRDMKVDALVGIESRGFIFGAVVAYQLGCPFALARKKGKLPYEKISESFALEYGWDVLEMHIDALKKGQKVVIMDDLLATGGTVSAVKKLVERLGAIPIESAFVIELTPLKGRDALHPLPVFSLIQFEEA